MGFRLDQALVELKLSRSREQSKELIKKGLITVGGKTVLKPSFLCSLDDDIKKIDSGEIEWVSRSGGKLAGALKQLKISLEGRICLDVGQSTGGFTQAMLSSGAQKVVGVDVGRDQLAESIKSDERVVCFESMDARDLSQIKGQFEFDFFAVDLSFISVLKVLEGLKETLKIGTPGFFLIKPQFEVGKKFVKKGGLVLDPLVHLDCQKNVLSYFKMQNISEL